MNVVETIQPYLTILKFVSLCPTVRGLKILQFIINQGGEIFSMRDVEHFMSCHRTETYKIIRDLEKKGYLEIEAIETDFEKSARRRANEKREKYGSARVKSIYRVNPQKLIENLEAKIKELQDVHDLLCSEITA